MNKILTFIFALAFCAFPLGLRAQLQLVAGVEPQPVFSGAAKRISVRFSNSAGQDFSGEIRARIFQASSATAVLLSDAACKRIEVPANETVLDSAALNFPDVKAKTRFLVQWLENSNILGTTEVLVYPVNLLEELRPLADDKAIGVFDPQNEFKPLLKNMRVEFEDLEDLGITNFSGKLAVVGAFQSRSQMPDDLPKEVEMLAKNNTAIVWIQPPPEKSGRLQPSFYSVPKKQIAVVVVQPDLVSNLAGNPQSQLNLIYFCKLALNPKPPALPDMTMN